MKLDKKVPTVLAFILITVFLGFGIGTAVVEVMQGHGDDTFIYNCFGYRVSWTYMLIASVVGSLAFLFAILARAIYLWRVKRGY
jgi:hypothetical protein